MTLECKVTPHPQKWLLTPYPDFVSFKLAMFFKEKIQKKKKKNSPADAAPVLDPKS